MIRVAAGLVLGTLLLFSPGRALSNPDLKSGNYVLEGARYEDGCYAPCECPVLVRDDLEGTLVLGTPVLADGFLTYPVTEISWRVEDPDGFTVHGSGTYRYAVGMSTQHEMVLDLAVDGGPVERYASGLVAADNGFQTLDIAVAKNGFYCRDTAFFIKAVPSNQPASWGAIKSLFARY